jgi:hypothetical protein
MFGYKKDPISAQNVEEESEKVKNDIETMLAELKKELGLQ